MKTHFEMNEKYQNLWNTAKPVLKSESILLIAMKK